MNNPGNELHEAATCVATKPTTWNEIKEQAHKIVEKARLGLPAEETRRWEQMGEKMSIDEACTKGKDILGLEG